MPKYILWDFDGTLGYREGGWASALIEAIGRNIPDHGFTAEQVRPFLQTGYPWHQPHRPYPARSAKKWWRDLYPVFERAFIGVGIATTQARQLAEEVPLVFTDPPYWRLYNDTLPTLIDLSEQGWTHLILSNHVPELSALVDSLGLAGLVSHIFNSAETGYEKPHPMAFRHALAALNSIEAIWMIGDNPIADVAGAEAAGIAAILVRKTDGQAKHQCSSLQEVPKILRQMQALPAV